MLEGLAHPTLDGIEEPRFSAIAGRWSAAAYPGRGASVFTSPHLVAFRSSRHPEAALDFLAHCARRESGRKILLDHHEFAARPSVWREAAAAGIPVPAAPLDGIAAALDRGIPFLPWVPQWLEMLRVLWDRIAACLGGRVEPKAALGETAREWDRLVAAQPLRFPYRE
jgi:ABC-type glycerol-3-phosphate transport system substrate-binding protein